MKFARVEVFFLIWMILLLFFIILYGIRKRRRILFDYAAGKGRRTLNVETSENRRFVKAGLTLLSILFLIVALTGPQYGFKWEEVEQRGVDIIVALDCSKSMLAEDIKPSRLERAKREIVDLLSMLKGDRVGLAAFAGTAFLQCPLTLDYSAFYIFLKALTPDFLPRGGTDLSAALMTAISGFERESRAEKAVIIITDGENTGDDPRDAVARARKEGIKVFAIGVGTQGGVPIPDEAGGYKKDDSGRIVVSRLDEDLLKRIAGDTGGVYVRSVAGDMDLEAIYENEIRGKMESVTLTMGKRKVWQDRFQWFLVMAIVALVAEMAIPATGKTAVFFIAWLLGGVVFPSPAFAQNAYDAVEKGVRAYERQKYDEALKHFIDAQIRAPEKPEISYNIGNAYYKLGRFDEAIKNYSAALKTEDQKLKEKTYYNMGNARFRQRRLEEAISNYQSALDIDPDDRQAKENLEFARQMMTRQQQQREDQSGDFPEKKEQEQNGGNDSQKPENQGPGGQNGDNEKKEPQEDRKDEEDPGIDDTGQNGFRDFSDSTHLPSDDENGSSKEGKDDAPGYEGPTQKEPSERMLNRLKDMPGKAMMPSYFPEKVEKDW